MNQRAFMCLLALAAFGCGTEQASPSVKSDKNNEVVTRNPKIPVEVSYPIVRDEGDGFAAKRTVDVKLNIKVSPEVLREIALEVKASEKHQYERTFIFVFLPEQVPGAKNLPWATCHFNSTLEVKILGLTTEAEETFRKLPVKHPGRRIGAWLLEGQFISSIHVIYQDGGKLTLGLVGANGDRFDSNMIELPSQDGSRRFQVEGSSEVYDVDRSGVLRMINRDGVVFAAALPLK